MTAYNTLSFCDVPERQMPHANALAATVQQLSAGLGVAAAAVALRAGSPLSRALADGTPQATYTIAFLLVALLPVAAIPGITRMQRDAGSAARTVTVTAKAWLRTTVRTRLIRTGVRRSRYPARFLAGVAGAQRERPP